MLIRLLLVTALQISSIISCLSPEVRSKGFVYLHEIDPTIQVSLRYYSNENFVGKTVDGYKKDVCVMTKQAAKALKAIQEIVKKDGYSLVVYDAYRPQKAVDNFMRWSKDIKDQVKKDEYYPRVDKARVFELGYVAEKSGHSRGSTVDLTLIKLGQKVHELKVTERKLLDGFTIKYLDDGTIDMGSSFDLFDLASHHENNLIANEFKKRRDYLKEKMTQNGFKTIEEEWWHYTLKNEPFPANQESSYHNFEVN